VGLTKLARPAHKCPATLVKRANGMILILDQGHKLGYFFPYSVNLQPSENLEGGWIQKQ